MHGTRWPLILTLGLSIACGTSGGRPDGGADAGVADAGLPDAGSHPDAGHPDAGTPDAGHPLDAGPPGLTCAMLLSCDQPCTSNACTNACYADSTAVAQGLFNTFDNCISATCSSGDGGPCASSSSTACGNCNESAATGPCIANLVGCENDVAVGPPNPDGGAEVPDAGEQDAGPRLNCGGLVACEGTCTGDAGACLTSCLAESTGEGQALLGALRRCQDMACPSSDGGACQMLGSGCTACVTQADFDNSLCGMSFSACQDDTSNNPDAGTHPVALQGGTVTQLVDGLNQPQVVLVQGGFAYYSQVASNGPVSRVLLSDGGVSNLSSAQPYPMGLALDSSNAYVWNSGSFNGSTTVNNGDGTVLQIPLDGGAPLTLASGLEVAYAAPYLNAIAVDAQRVYWVSGAIGNDGAIMTCPIGTAAPTALYSNQPFPEAVATDGVHVFWTNWGTFNAQGQYNNDGTVLQGDVDGGPVITLATGQSAPAAIAFDSANVYWTNAGRLGGDNLPAPSTGAVMQAAIGGGHLVSLASNQPIPLGIAVAGQTVYWDDYTLNAPGQVVSIAVGGGSIAPLVAGTANPFGITVSNGALYWTSSPPTAQGSGSLWVLSPLP